MTDSIKQSGGIDNKKAFQHLLSLLKYVSGDYNDSSTYAAIKQALGKARRPAHYLAIPPSLFQTVIKAWAHQDWPRMRASSSKSPLAATWLRLAPLTVRRDRFSLKSQFFASITSSAKKRS